MGLNGSSNEAKKLESTNTFAGKFFIKVELTKLWDLPIFEIRLLRLFYTFKQFQSEMLVLKSLIRGPSSTTERSWI